MFEQMEGHFTKYITAIGFVFYFNVWHIFKHFNRDISVDDYFLLVESIDTEVVAFAPMLASHHPRVIAVGEGNGDLLRVTLLVTEECRTARRNSMVGGTKMPKVNPPPLASALAAVEVDFNNGNHESMSSISNRHELLQNDGIIGKSKFRNAGGDLADIIGNKLYLHIYFAI